MKEAAKLRRFSMGREDLQSIAVSCFGKYCSVKIGGVEISNVKAYRLEQNSDGSARLTLDFDCCFADTQMALNQPAN